VPNVLRRGLISLGAPLRTRNWGTRITKMKLWSLRSAYNNYEIIVVTASLGVTRRRSLCRHVLLTAGIIAYKHLVKTSYLMVTNRYATPQDFRSTTTEGQRSPSVLRFWDHRAHA